MKIEIEANEKEIAALFDMIRGHRKNDCDVDALVKELTQRLPSAIESRINRNDANKNQAINEVHTTFPSTFTIKAVNTIDPGFYKNI